MPGLRPDSDSSRDFGSRKVYPRENWDILKKNDAAQAKSTVARSRSSVRYGRNGLATEFSSISPPTQLLIGLLGDFGTMSIKPSVFYCCVYIYNTLQLQLYLLVALVTRILEE